MSLGKDLLSFNRSSMLVGLDRFSLEFEDATVRHQYLSDLEPVRRYIFMICSLLLSLYNIQLLYTAPSVDQKLSQAVQIGRYDILPLSYIDLPRDPGIRGCSLN